MITVIAGYEPKVFTVQLDPQDPVNRRQRVLRVRDRDGVTVALFANWTTAIRENDPEPEPGFLRRQAAAEAGIPLPKGSNA